MTELDSPESHIYISTRGYRGCLNSACEIENLEGTLREKWRCKLLLKFQFDGDSLSPCVLILSKTWRSLSMCSVYVIEKMIKSSRYVKQMLRLGPSKQSSIRSWKVARGVDKSKWHLILVKTEWSNGESCALFVSLPKLKSDDILPSYLELWSWCCLVELPEYHLYVVMHSFLPLYFNLVDDSPRTS